MPDNFDGFLKIEGVTSECKDPDHKDWIDVDSFSLGCTVSDFAIGPEGKLVADDPNLAPMTFTCGMHKGSPTLYLFCVMGKQIPKVEFHARTGAGDKQHTYLIIELEDCLITSVSEGISSEPLPTETISIAFVKINYTYFEQDTATGTAASGGAVNIAYDQAMAAELE
jgi:type VI secretion system secreted protein Hcp